MKLVFYSGGQERKNHHIHRSLVGLIRKKSKKTLTYFPFCFEGYRTFYSRAIRRYRSFGITHFFSLPVDQPILKKDLRQALKSDVIYLAGGNTFYFLFYLRKSGLLKKLQIFAKDGGVLAGLSAGAIILTPNIKLAGYPSYDRDENEIGLKNLNALNLTHFEFFPHYYPTPRLRKSLAKYSIQSHHTVIACRDGGGLILNGDQKQFFGKVTYFQKGREFTL